MVIEVSVSIACRLCRERVSTLALEAKECDGSPPRLPMRVGASETGGDEGGSLPTASSTGRRRCTDDESPITGEGRCVQIVITLAGAKPDAS